LQQPDRPELRLTHETIYQAVYRADRGGLMRSRSSLLRTRRTCRKRHRSREQRIPRCTDRSKSIHDRPTTADDRGTAGHWEGDLIMGAHNQTVIGTLVERGRNTAHFRDQLISVFSTLPAKLRQLPAWDQGIEMGWHAEFTAATSTPVYSCDPASPWQRGFNENANGLLRQCFPKSSDLSVHTAEDLTAVTAELNNRPRKILGWDTRPAVHPIARPSRMITFTNLPMSGNLIMIRDPAIVTASTCAAKSISISLGATDARGLSLAPKFQTRTAWSLLPETMTGRPSSCPTATLGPEPPRVRFMLSWAGDGYTHRETSPTLRPCCTS
jgi:hypothetical protein